MDTVTAPPPTADRPHLPEPHTHLIEAHLTKIEDVARDTKLYSFQRVEGGVLPPYQPGAHIDLHLPNGLLRQFSLVAPNSDPESYVVAVKKDAGSRGGSRYIIDEMKVGDPIKISAPRNNFPLVENAEHVVLIAGGIGITPIWCMAQQLIALKRPWTLHYACQ
ncbi:MAG: ferredoxin reductase, partial [Xanthobacteraceae bacterium]